MKKLFKEYGGVITTVIAIVALIGIISLTISGPNGGWVGDAFQKVISEFADTVNNKIDGDDDIPTIEELQSMYKFEYYSTLSSAVADVNADVIGENADAEKTNAIAGIYIDKAGVPNVVLLKDTTEADRITLSKDTTINLGGNKVTFNSIGFDTVNDNGNEIFIDGRLSGSEISCSSESATIVAIQLRRSNHITVKGVTINAEAASKSSYAIHSTSATDEAPSLITVENCNITATADGTSNGINGQNYVNVNVKNSNITTKSTNDLANGINVNANANIESCNVSSTSSNSMAYGINCSTNSCVTASNCNVSSTSSNGKAYGINCAENSRATASNCNINAYANYTYGVETYYGMLSQGVSAAQNTNVTLNDCYVYGSHVGIQFKGNLTVNGGTYEGHGHGGIYFSGANTTSYIKNATLRTSEFKTTDGVHTVTASQNNAGFYVGGSDGENITVYMDNCNIYGPSAPFTLRGSENEKNNTVYISNSTINKNYSYGIRVDNVTHRLYIGKGNNFDISDVRKVDGLDLSTVVFETNEVYCQ